MKEDNENLFANLTKSYHKYQEICKILSAKKYHSPILSSSDIINIFFRVTNKIFSDPAMLLELQIEYTKSQIELYNNFNQRIKGESFKELFTQDKRDKRFLDEEWDESILFNYLKQLYLMNSSMIRKVIDKIEGIDKKELRKLDFYLRQFIDAISPSNFPLTNPRVIKEISMTGGKNIVEGLDNLLNDIKKSKGVFKIKTSQSEGFKIGVNIACTKGKVIYRNKIMELIHYEPKDSIYEKPLLIVPPWINKYYILDLREKNSFIKWLVDLGYNVFLISWVNPTAKHKNINFEDYMNLGPIEAIKLINEKMKFPKINVIGYCVGGTVLSCAIAYLKSKNINIVNSATFFTTLLDFANAGDIQIFTDSDNIDAIEEHMNKQGYLDGGDMALCFSMIRANDMIWSFFINNYLLGKEPFPIDLLFWNSDSTKLPAKMHGFYLRNFYLNNLLKKGQLKLLDEVIDLKKIDCECYFISTIEDHIAPWKSTFQAHKLISGNIRFVLGASGHVAGVINHPNNNKYCYFINENSDVSSPSKWLKSSVMKEGSWWLDWHEWQKKSSGKKKLKQILNKNIPEAICDAPGEYIFNTKTKQ